uniref:Putative secreted protein n=1 Tax=Anopheles darlingi TaxID=43151 RepID=A0A2M4DRR0_ANODA
MMYVLLLFLQKVITDRVERIRAQLVVTQQHKQQIERNATLEVDVLVLSPAHLLRLDDRILDHRADVCDPSEVLKSGHLQMAGTV